MAKKIQIESILRLTDVDIDPRIFQKISRAIAGVPISLGQTNTKLKQADRSMRQLATSTQSVRPALEGNARAARLFLQRMTQFAILLPAFATLNKALQGSVSFLVDLEKEVKSIISLDIEGLGSRFNDIADAAFRIGAEFRVSALDAAKGIKLFVQAGFSLEEATDLASQSALAAKVSTLEMAEAQEFAIAATKIFGDELGDLGEAFDKIVRVEDLAAVGAQDIAQAFRTGGNALAFATKSFEDTIGLIAGLREQTRKSGREVGTFFKTLSIRITAAGEAQNAVKGLGVEIANLDGSLRPLAEVLTDIKGKFDGLTESQQANISKSIAGVRQGEAFLATIKSLDRGLQLSAQASDALGTAQAKNEVIATSLSEKLQQLRVSGQELSRTIGEAGIGDALNSAVTSATKLLDVFAKGIKLADDLGASLTPVLTLFAGVATASVLGVGGGFRNLTSGGGKAGGGGAGGAGFSPGVQAMDEAAARAAQSLEAMRATTARLQQQTVLTNAAGKQLVEARSRNIVSIREATVAQTGFTASLKSGGVAAQRGLSSALKSTVGRIGIFTAASLGAGAALNGLKDSADTANQSVRNNFLEIAGSATQTGLQFALLNPLLGVAVAGFAVLGGSIKRFAEEAENNRVAFRGQAEGKQRRQGQEAFADITGADLIGKVLIEDIAKGIRGRTSQQIDFDAIFGKAFQGLDSTAKVFIKDVDSLKDVLFDPTLGKDVIRNLSDLESEFFVNEEAIAALRSSYDDTGKSSLAFNEQLDLLFKAMGRVERAVDPVTGQIEDFVFTFEEFQRRFATQKVFQELQVLSMALEDAGKAPQEMAKGVDKLRIVAERSATAFTVAESNFAQFQERLRTLEGGNVFGDLEGAKEIFTEAIKLASLPSGAASTEAIVKFLNKLPDEEAAFVKKFIAAERQRFKSSIEAAEAAQAVQVEIFNRNQALAEAEQQAAQSAQKSLDDFRISLLEFGGDAEAALGNIDGLANLTGIEKAQRELDTVSASAAIKVETLSSEISSLDAQINSLAGAADNTEGAFKRAELSQERNLLLLNKEDIGRKEVIDTIKARVGLAQAEAKAAEDAAQAEEERIKALEAFVDSTDEFSAALMEAGRSFEEFELDRLADLASQEASALGDLKSAQQDVLSATADLDSAYSDLISAILSANDAIAESQIRYNSLQREIDILTGGISTFEGRLQSLNSSFRDVLNDANITLEQRIQLERQLAEETLSFLQQARDEIVSSGLNVFGQSGSENAELAKGIAALQFVADQLGGSFENFLNLSSGDFAAISEVLLNLPLSLRQSILDALQSLPSTASIGGFSVEQLREALGQVGAGIDPEVGLPSLEELTNQQVDQLQILQDLALKDAQLQFAQVAEAQRAVEAAEEQLDVAKIAEERAREELGLIREGIQQEVDVLNTANAERQELTAAVIAANDRNTLKQIEKEAQLFADQNATFREVGDFIVQGVGNIVAARLAVIGASDAIGAATGHIPNFAGGNLTPGEAAGILRAASREKRAMPGGAGLAVANTSEAIIPMRNRGFIPNFQNGNSDIAAGVSAIKAINETVVAAIARSVTQALTDIEGGGNNEELLEAAVSNLSDISSRLDDINESNNAIQSNTTGTDTDTGTTAVGTSQDVNITLQTNGQSTLAVTGLENLTTEIRNAVQEAAAEQVDEQLDVLLDQLDSILQVLQERGLLSSLGQAG
jgi:TP901 family phage tail tape measure protein